MPCSNLNNPRKQLLGKAVLNAGWIFFSLHSGRKLAQGFLAAEGGAFGLGLQSCLAARGFLVFIKILGLSFEVAPLDMTVL